MTNEVQLYRDADQITISVGGNISTMHIGEWSKLIVKPKTKDSNVFQFARSGAPSQDYSLSMYDHMPSDTEPA